MKLTITYKNGNQFTFKNVEWVNVKNNAIEFFKNEGISFIHGYEPVTIKLNSIADFLIRS